MTKKLKFGVIGVGNIARWHALGYGKSEIAELYAVCDLNEELAKQRHREWNTTKWYTNYKDLLADPEIDAVEVITPHHLHVSMGVEALEAGKHVSMQKPMAMNSDECDQLIEAARKSGKQLRVFENFRYYPPLVKAKELLDSGAIGDPVSIRLKVTQGHAGPKWEIPFERWNWRFNPEIGGGGRMIFDYGYHLFSIAMWMLGDVEEVFSYINHTEIDFGWKLDAPAMVVWKHKDGNLGSYEAMYSKDLLIPTKLVPEDEWFEITGTKGFIWVNRCTSELLDGPPVIMQVDGTRTSFSNIDSDPLSSFIAGVDDFARCLLEGRQAMLSPEEGKRVNQFCKAIEKSAADGQPVKLDDA
jgi:predicted dehydrogenase